MKKKTKAPESYFYKKVVKIPIYFGNFIIVFSNDRKKVANLIHTHPDNIENLYGHTFHNFLHGGFESFCVCFNFWSATPVTMGVIVHEITHAGSRVLLARDVIPDWDNDEAECYLKGWMGDQVAKFMEECGIS